MKWELLKIFESVYTGLGLTDTLIKLNNRKILAGLAEIIGAEEQLTEMTVIIDKLDKIGIEKVNEELKNKGFGEKSLETINSFLAISGSNEEKLLGLHSLLSASEMGKKGIQELENLYQLTQLAKVERVEIDPTLARGLDYYTGAIYEAKPADGSMSTIGSGGRYDNLTEVFGLKDMSGVGISFGADRIYDLLEMRDLFPKHLNKTCDVLVLNFDEALIPGALSIVQKLRRNDMSAMIYPDPVKIKKQMKYAHNLEIPFVIIYGEDEKSSETFVLKNMVQGSQESHQLKDLESVMMKADIPGREE